MEVVKKIQVRVSEEIKTLFEFVCEKEQLNQAELLEKILLYYQTNKIEKESLFERIHQQNNILLEYVSLLVKVNKDMPTIPGEMKKFINGESRFACLIEEKVESNE